MEKFNLILYKGFPRGSVKVAKKHFNSKPIVAIEIGTSYGKNASSILKELNINKIYLIDSYSTYIDGFTGRKYTEEIQESAKNKSKDLFKNNSNVIPIYKNSDSAIKDIREKADFIYIDGAHDYGHVRKDIENYWNILNEGGIIAGHDIKMFDVFRAVTHFCDENKLTARTLKDDWYIVKSIE